MLGELSFMTTLTRTNIIRVAIMMTMSWVLPTLKEARLVSAKGNRVVVGDHGVDVEDGVFQFDLKQVRPSNCLLRVQR
jgi:hypothetical protein